MKEHIRDSKPSANPKTGFSQHLHNTGHIFDPNKKLEILKVVNNSKKLDVNEMFYIHKYKKIGNFSITRQILKTTLY